MSILTPDRNIGYTRFSHLMKLIPEYHIKDFPVTHLGPFPSQVVCSPVRGLVLKKDITYFLAWSISFYPQVLLNYRRKSVQGLSIDFLYLNVIGFFCYSIFNLVFFYSKEIQDQCKHPDHEDQCRMLLHRFGTLDHQRYKDSDSLVRGNDVIFSVHAFLISCVTLGQALYYKSDNHLSISTRMYLDVIALLTVLHFAQVLIGEDQWLDFIYFFGSMKFLVSVVKYVPQAFMNYKRKSTVGWSIHNILLDFTGGMLSSLQLILDAAIAKDSSGITGDFVKLGLGLVAILFDCIFMVQHYILYPSRVDSSLTEREPLIV
ncbi:PQ-loop-domain-containing protein [Hesseltinella vesiculosa]|uniref:PQ-loop-domain-containing protein n=1 Tax=Hesseltinella vesiculosa TaxID=101127 RepID=A0A1X2GIF6_9FUNG|nr:PQ-loop-domain-containing protein [Hesseltinella vesiculosa]